MDLTSSYTKGRELQTGGPGAAYGFQRPRSLGDLSPETLAALLSAKAARVNRSAGGRGVDDGLPGPVVGYTNVPAGGDALAGRSISLPRKITRMRRLQGAQMPGQSQAAMTGWGMAGGGPAAGITHRDVAETYLGPGLGWSGDAMYGTLEGNEAAARTAMVLNAQDRAGAFSPDDDPRMRALSARQDAALHGERRFPLSLIESRRR